MQTTKGPSRSTIESWMISNLAELLGLRADEIEVDQPFSRLGLDSAAAIGLVGELEELLGRHLSPTLVYDHPTIAALARHLGAEE